jgi:hypothetical protein
MINTSRSVLLENRDKYQNNPHLVAHYNNWLRKLELHAEELAQEKIRYGNSMPMQCVNKN